MYYCTLAYEDIAMKLITSNTKMSNKRLLDLISGFF